MTEGEGTPRGAGMAGETLEYAVDGRSHHGFVVTPAATNDAPAPAVLVNHAWSGQTAFERDKCAWLAELGYVGVALDTYGGGHNGASKEESRTLMAPLVDDRGLLKRRLLAGYEAAKAHPAVDASRVAAIGFCFGGLCALDLARSGAPLRGVASFHGLLAPNGLPERRIVAKVLVCHGYDDPMAPPSELFALTEELTRAGCDWQVHAYGKTVHAFTNPAANDPGFGTVYSATAERRALSSLRGFLAEAFDAEVPR